VGRGEVGVGVVAENEEKESDDRSGEGMDADSGGGLMGG